MNKGVKILLGIFIVFSLLIVLSCDDDNDNSTKPNQVVDPTFSISSGVYNTVLQVEITSSTEDVQIYYSLDDSEPTELSLIYNEPINIFRTTTIKARAFKSNYQPSNIIIADYEIVLPNVATPTFTPEPGTYLEGQTITISCSTLEAEIYYTLDGSQPTESSLWYENPLDITSNSTIKARAFKNYYPPSEIFVGEYEFTNNTVALPVFNPTPGSYNGAQLITLSCYTTGAVIHYTLDGSLPTMASDIYINPLDISSTTTIKAFASKDNYLPSTVTSARYEINYQTVLPPVFSPEPGDYQGEQSVRLINTTSGATTYYTLDGSEPTESSLLYNNTLEITTTTTIKARAFKDEFLPSEIIVGNYNIFYQTVATPIFSPIPGNYSGEQLISLTCANPGATIHYTLYGSEPTEASQVYSAPFIITSSKIIKARAFENDYYPSEIAVGEYIIDESTSFGSKSIPGVK